MGQNFVAFSEYLNFTSSGVQGVPPFENIYQHKYSTYSDIYSVISIQDGRFFQIFVVFLEKLKFIINTPKFQNLT